ncbi:MAG: hypothetical protein V2A76_18280 [Planctomycetota bacterium]
MTSMNKTRWSRFLTGSVMVVVLAICLGLWSRAGLLTGTAQAQVPDSGLQRKQMLEQMVRTNQLLTEIKQILEGGTVQVKSGQEKKEK